MINSEARVKMIFSAVALLTEHCFKAGISAINQFRIANDTGRGQKQRWEGGLSFSSLLLPVLGAVCHEAAREVANFHYSTQAHKYLHGFRGLEDDAPW